LKVHSATRKLAEVSRLGHRAYGTPFTGADLANLLNEAAILTASAGKEAPPSRESDDCGRSGHCRMEGKPLTA